MNRRSRVSRRVIVWCVFRRWLKCKEKCLSIGRRDGSYIFAENKKKKETKRVKSGWPVIGCASNRGELRIFPFLLELQMTMDLPPRRRRGEFNFNRHKICVIANIIPLDGIMLYLSPVIPRRWKERKEWGSGRGERERDFNRLPRIISRNNLRVTTRAAMNNN